jgi:rhodanese-related sulfurtransferase
MDQFISFVIRHWELWLLLAALVAALGALEIRDRFFGVRGLSSHEVTNLINREEATILDIRDNAHFVKGHILGSVNMPVKQIDEQTKQLEKYKSKPLIIVYSANQAVSAAASLLIKQGFTQVYTLKGGIATWQSANLPLEKK